MGARNMNDCSDNFNLFTEHSRVCAEMFSNAFMLLATSFSAKLYIR